MTQPRRVSDSTPPGGDGVLGSSEARARAAARPYSHESELKVAAFEAKDAARIIAGPDGKIQIFNGLATELFGMLKGEDIKERIFRHVERLHSRRRSEQSNGTKELPLPHGLLMFDKLLTGNRRSVKDHVVIHTRMKNSISAVFKIDVLAIGGGPWYKVEIDDISEFQRDHLTPLGDANLLRLKLSDEIHLRRTCKKSGPLSLLLLDLDGFKKINDTHGHAAADEALRVFGERLAEHARRSTDTPARLHGDEFCVLVDDEPLVAIGLAERIKDAVKTDPAAVKADGELVEIFLSTSIGVIAYVEGDTVESMLERADKAMYQAKRNGRCRVEFLHA